MIVDLKSIKNKKDFEEWLSIKEKYNKGYKDEAIILAIEKMQPYITKRKISLNNKVNTYDDIEDFEQESKIAIMRTFSKWKPFKCIKNDGTIIYVDNYDENDESIVLVQGRLAYSYFKKAIDCTECNLFRQKKSIKESPVETSQLRNINDTYKINGRRITSDSNIDLGILIERKDVLQKWLELCNELEKEKILKGVKGASYSKRKRKMLKFLNDNHITYQDLV